MSDNLEEDPLNNPFALCSFCGKPHDEVEQLIAGPGVYICDECTRVCAKILVKNGHELNLDSVEIPQN